MNVLYRVVFASWVLAWGAAAAASEPLTAIRIGLPDQGASSKPFSQGPLGVAHIRQQLEQAFKQDGVAIEWHFFKGAGPAVNEALANEQLDVAVLGDLAAIIGRASGLKTKVIAGGRGANTYLATTPESEISSLKELPGKRIALYRGTADQLSFGRALAEVGLQERDLQIINLDWNASRAALAARQIDAVWSGLALLALEPQGITYPTSTKQLSRTTTTQSAVLATEHFIAAHPEALQRLVDVLVGNAAWISRSENGAAYLSLIEAQSGIPAALFARDLAGDDLRFRYSPRLDPFLLSSFQSSVDQAKSLGLIRKSFQVHEWFDPRFVDQAILSQKLDPLWPEFDHQGAAIPR